MGKYTDIDDSSVHFQTLLYTGNSGNPRDLVNDGNSDLQPDLVWIKGRSHADLHLLYDSSRGAGKFLRTESTAAENTGGYGLTAFNSDGFRTNAYAYSNENTHTYVAWQWKANGGTTSSNTDGNITATVQANPTAGFSIVTYTGNGVQTGKTVGHGLGAVPKMIISKDRGATSNVATWRTYHEAIGNTKYLQMPQTDAASVFNDWDNTTPTSSVYSVGGDGGYTPTNTNNTNYVAYVFAEVQGYSKFGGYTGNGNSNGPFVYTGFKPAWILIKRYDSTSGWTVYDHKRGFNGNNYELFPHSAEVEYTGTSYFEADILSNGFKLRLTDGQVNASSGTYVYAAFAENPFVTSTGIMGTAR